MAAQVGADYANKIMHARFVGDGLRFMASDGMPGQDRPSSSNVALSLYTANSQDGARVFDALSQGGTVSMPLQEVFWGGRFGMLTDRYGIEWMMSTG